MRIITLEHRHTKRYLLQGAAKWLLFDAGWPDSRGPFFQTMRENGVRPGGIQYLVLSHFHADHAGLSQPIRNLGATLLLHTCQSAAVQGMNVFFQKKPNRDYVPIETDGIVAVTSPESRIRLAEMGLDGEIIATPGHSGDSVSLVIGGRAFVGDLPQLGLADSNSDPSISESWRRIFAAGATRACFKTLDTHLRRRKAPFLRSKSLK